MNRKEKYKVFIKGDFHSSFSTIETNETKLKINSSITDTESISKFNFIGLKKILNLEITEEDFDISSKTKIFIENIDNVGLYPLILSDYPLNSNVRLSLKKVYLYDIILDNQQFVDGVLHGSFRSKIFCLLSNETSDKALKTDSDNIKTIDFNLKELNYNDRKTDKNSSKVNITHTQILDKNNLDSQNETFIDNEVSNIIEKDSSTPLFNRKGCFSFFKSGCLPLFLFFILLGLLSLLLRNCSNFLTTVRDDDTSESKLDEGDKKEVIEGDTIKEVRLIPLPSVKFYTNNFQLLPSSKKELQLLAVELLNNPTLNCKIFGYTDNKGDSDSNLILSQNRSNEVLSFLVKEGVNKNRLSAIGMGEKNPIADNNSAEGRMLNRRVVVELTEKISLKD